MLVAIAATGGWFAWRKLSPAAKTGGPAGSAAIRTAVVATGGLKKTLRLTGATTADKFASLTAPQLRGSRGGAGMTVVVASGGGGGRGGGMSVTTVSSMGSGGGGGGRDSGSGGGGRDGGSGGSSSSGTSSTASGSPGSSTSASAGTGTTGSGAGGSAAGGTGMSSFRGASNRFGNSTASTKTQSSTVSRSSSATSRSGGGGGGDRGEGGMSGGASDFMQVLQKVAKPGSLVKKGDTVAEFDRQFQQLRLEDYRATVQQSERSMKAIDADLDVQRKSNELGIQQAKAAVEKARLDIKTTPVRSVIQAEQLKLALEEAEAKLKQLQTQLPFQETSLRSQRRDSEISVDQSKVELKRAERNVDLLAMTASMDGMLVMENMRRGNEFSQIQQGDQLMPGQLFARIVDPSSMMVSATVNQTDVEFIRVGAKAMLQFDAYPGLELPAHVVSMGAITNPGGQRAAFVKEIPVYLKIDKMDPRVIPDLSVSVDVLIQSGGDFLLAPLESVFRDSPASKPYVFVRTAAGFQKREIELGLRNHIAAAVTSGLKVGEVIALEQPIAPDAGAQSAAAAAVASEATAKVVAVLDAAPPRRQAIGAIHVV
ncbi:MAG: HlyD family efflux transporter periplasmic adaptor subunit [Candidatus Solibacter usitatus]|nr:HlyD family efflux transporter periplasmic adaptor subunit [Candidatus Solibacter usitatus]